MTKKVLTFIYVKKMSVLIAKCSRVRKNLPKIKFTYHICFNLGTAESFLSIFPSFEAGFADENSRLK